MKLKLIKVKFNDTFTYKYLPFEYCCDEIQENGVIVFADRDFAYTQDFYDDEEDATDFIPQFCTTLTEERTSYEDIWEETTNYPINFCPHCGEKIEIEVSDEIDLSSQFSVLVEKRNSLFKASNRTDSKKREQELREQVRELDQKINWFFSLAEWNGEYIDEEKI